MAAWLAVHCLCFSFRPELDVDNHIRWLADIRIDQKALNLKRRRTMLTIGITRSNTVSIR